MVVVIGAGVNGLVAAVRLASRGVPVVVLESAPEPGGGVRSTVRDGFVHDDCAAFFPLAAASSAFRALELDVDWVNPPVVMAHVFDDGSALPLYRDVGETAAAVGSSWASLMETLWPVRWSLVELGFGRLPPLRAAARVVRGLGREALSLAPLAVASSAVIGRSLFGSERSAGWLAGSGAHADVSPFAPASGAFSLGLN